MTYNRYIHMWVYIHTYIHTPKIHPNITKRYKVYKVKSSFPPFLSDLSPTIYSALCIYSAFPYKDSHLHFF